MSKPQLPVVLTVRPGSQLINMACKVCLWTAPRGLSTVFERSVREVENVTVFHEPYSLPFYFGPEYQSDIKLKGHGKAVDEKYSYDNITKSFTEHCDKNGFIFVKNLAYFLNNHFNELLKEEMKDFKHTFIIRHPSKVVLSHHREVKRREQMGLKSYRANAMGYESLFNLYKFVVNNLDKNPVIIDADDLIDNPRGMMEAYCNAVGIKFDERMLTWEAKEFPDWKPCAEWHLSVINSTGFFKNSKSEESARKEEIERLPDEFKDIIKKSLPLYEELSRNKLHL